MHLKPMSARHCYICDCPKPEPGLFCHACARAYSMPYLGRNPADTQPIAISDIEEALQTLELAA